MLIELEWNGAARGTLTSYFAGRFGGRVRTAGIVVLEQRLLARRGSVLADVAINRTCQNNATESQSHLLFPGTSGRVLSALNSNGSWSRGRLITTHTTNQPHHVAPWTRASEMTWTLPCRVLRRSYIAESRRWSCQRRYWRHRFGRPGGGALGELTRAPCWMSSFHVLRLRGEGHWDMERDLCARCGYIRHGRRANYPHPKSHLISRNRSQGIYPTIVGVESPSLGLP